MYKRITLQLSGLLLLLLASTSQAKQDEVLNALNNKEYGSALEMLQNMPKEERQQPARRLQEASALAGKGMQKKAEERYRSLIQDFPKQPEAYNNLAVLYASQGRLDEAKAMLEQALKTNDSYATVYGNLSSIYYEMSRSAYAKALQLKQKHQGPHLAAIYTPNNLPQPQTLASAKPQPAPVPEPPKPVKVPAAVTPPAPVKAALMEVKELEAKPQPADSENERREAVMSTLKRWAGDWAGQNVEGYLQAYAADFRPAHGIPLQQWQKQRRKRLSKPESIEVQLSGFSVNFANDTTAEVTAIQEYRSKRYSDRVRKRFLLSLEADGWKISREVTLEVLS